MSKLSELLHSQPAVQALLTRARNADDMLNQAVADALVEIEKAVEKHFVGPDTPPAPTHVVATIPAPVAAPTSAAPPANDTQWPSVTGGAELAHGLVSPALPPVSKRSDT